MVEPSASVEGVFGIEYVRRDTNEDELVAVSDPVLPAGPVLGDARLLIVKRGAENRLRVRTTGISTNGSSQVRSVSSLSSFGSSSISLSSSSPVLLSFICISVSTLIRVIELVLLATCTSAVLTPLLDLVVANAAEAEDEVSLREAVGVPDREMSAGGGGVGIGDDDTVRGEGMAAIQSNEDER